MENLIWILALIGLAAFLYASVGHGGASSYLTILGFTSMLPQEIKITTLILNVLVAGISMLQYHKNTDYPWRFLLLLSLGSIPMAYLGGSIQLDPSIYKKAIGTILIFPILQFSGFFHWAIENNKRVWYISNNQKNVMLIFLGAFIGYISGLIGIGGGIILSPVILYFGWLNAKETAGLSAGFIVLNSMSGLIAQHQVIPQIVQFNWIYLLLVSGTFGFLGSKWGAQKLNNFALKRMLALVLFIASMKLIFS